MESNQALIKLGAFGRWQIKNYVLFCFSVMFVPAWQSISIVYIGELDGTICIMKIMGLIGNQHFLESLLNQKPTPVHFPRSINSPLLHSLTFIELPNFHHSVTTNPSTAPIRSNNPPFKHSLQLTRLQT